MQSPIRGNVEIPIPWKYSLETHIIPRLWVCEESRIYYEIQTIPRA